MTSEIPTEFPITISCNGGGAEKVIYKLEDILTAQEMVTNLRSAGMSQIRISKHIQCPQANVSRWQAGLCKPNGTYMMRLVALWKEKCNVI